MSTPATRFGVLINPTAGNGRGLRQGRRVLAEMERRGLRTVDLSRPHPATAFAHARDTRAQYDALIVVGGDGMAHMGINLVARTSTPLGLIPVGSGNDFARHLGLPIKNVARALDVIEEALRAGPQALDALRITPHHPDQWEPGCYPDTHRWAGCVVSVGFDSMVNARANTYRWPRGKARYVRGVLQELRTFAPYEYRMTIAGGSAETFTGTLVALANAPSFGGGMKIAPAAHAASGSMEVVIAGAVSKGELLRVFPKIYSGAHIHHPVVRTLAATEVHIGPGGQARIPGVFADGEHVGSAPVRVTVESGAVQMLCRRLGT